MLKKITLILILTLSISTYVLSQNSDFKIFLKGGISNYGDTPAFKFAGGYGGPGEWYAGPIVGLGLEYGLNRGWFLQSSLEYSNHIYGEPDAAGVTMERGNNVVVDALGILKKRWNWFYMIVGIGYSFQKSTSSYKSGYVDGVYFHKDEYEGSSHTVFAGLLGIGVEVYFFENIGMFIEGSYRLREYVTPVAQLGINYRI